MIEAAVSTFIHNDNPTSTITIHTRWTEILLVFPLFVISDVDGKSSRLVRYPEPPVSCPLTTAN